MTPSEGTTSTSQSLERGLAILASFKSERPQIGISELSRDLALSRSTTHRYVTTLSRLDYLVQDPESKRYRLGPRVLDLGFSAINSMDLREIAAPHLRQLSDETRHTVNLAILDGVDVVTIDRCRGARPGEQDIDFDLDLRVGARLPAYCTAVGKAMLAFVAESRREEIIEQIDFVARGPNTLIDPAAFRAELARIRVSGVAINDEELAYGLRSIAAPIHSHSGEVLAALNLAVHRTMVTMEELTERFGPAVLRAAQGVSRSMGHRVGATG